jgi:hypothetical protein
MSNAEPAPRVEINLRREYFIAITSALWLFSKKVRGGNMQRI